MAKDVPSPFPVHTHGIVIGIREMGTAGFGATEDAGRVCATQGTIEWTRSRRASNVADLSTASAAIAVRLAGPRKDFNSGVAINHLRTHIG